MEDLKLLYEKERERLMTLADADSPQGEYAHPVFGTGCMQDGVMFIGEAPGAQETLQGIPFVGKAGQQLDELLQDAGISREQVFITNAVKYRPCVRSAKSVRNRPPTKQELTAGQALLKNEILLCAPRVIVTLGNSPLSSVLAIFGKEPAVVGSVHGTAIPLTDQERPLLFPCYHPASCIYNRALKPVLFEDMRNLGRLVRGE